MFFAIIINSDFLLYLQGIDKSLRKEVWKYLLGYFKYGCTLQSRHTLFRAKE